MKVKLIEAAKEYASENHGGVTINNPKLYKAFRDGQDNALSIAAAPSLKAENERLREALQKLRDSFIHIDGDTKGNQARTNMIKYCDNCKEALNFARLVADK